MLELQEVHRMAASIPFMLAAVSGQPQKINATRVVEAVVIASIIAGGGYFIALPVLTKEVESINKSLARVEAKIAAIEQRIEQRREVRDQQYESVKSDINRIKVDIERRR